jgi:dephospho-CoA kinase
MKSIIVGLVGPLGVGKTTVASWFQEKGYTVLSLSDPIRAEAKKLGLPLERQVFQDIGDRWRAKYGLDFLSKLLIAEIEKNPDYSYVVEGFRNPGEIKLFQTLPNFVLIGLNADPKVRFERVKARADSHDPDSWETFQKQEARDQGIGQPEHGQQVISSLELADFVIDTDKVQSEVFEQVEKVLEEYRNDPNKTIARRSQECSFC